MYLLFLFRLGLFLQTFLNLFSVVNETLVFNTEFYVHPNLSV